MWADDLIARDRHQPQVNAEEKVQACVIAHAQRASSISSSLTAAEVIAMLKLNLVFAIRKIRCSKVGP